MLYLRTLGGLSLEPGGRPLTGAGTQRSRLALLAVLAVAGDRGVSRESLVALFWPESDTDRARGALKQALFVLRRDLYEPALTRGTTELALNPAVIGSDVAEFERAVREGALERAAGLNRGVFLEGVHINGGEFDRWLDQVRERLASLHRQVLERLAHGAERQGDHAEAVRWWRLLAATDRLSSSVAGALMRALVAVGDSAGALQHAQAHAQLVRSELEAAPDPAVQALAVRIRRDAEVRTVAPRAVAEVTTPPSAPAPEVVPELIGRGPARRWVQAAIAAGVVALAVAVWRVVAGGSAAAFDPDIVLLTGLPGDSLLLAEVASGLTRRDPSLRVLTGPRRAGARYLSRITSEIEGDSIRFAAGLDDAATDTRREPIGPVVVARAAAPAGIRGLSDRLAIVLAARRDPFFANWAYAAALPVSWESFEQLSLGIRDWVHDRVPPAAARARFHSASALDSTSATALLWEAFVTEEDGAPTGSDSILRLAESSGWRMGPWERALGGFIKARNRGDLPGAHTAGHQLLDVVPNSEWVYMVAEDAFSLARPREAVALTDLVRARPGWSLNWGTGFIIRDIALHMSGDFQAELALAREALRSDPDSRLYLQLEVKALASMGRVAEVTRICERSQSLRPGPMTLDWQPWGQAYLEFAAHGFPQAARDLAERMLEAREQSGQGTPVQQLIDRAGAYSHLAAWEDMERVLQQVGRAGRTDGDYAELLTMAKAFRHDTVGLVEAQRLLDSLRPPKDADPEVLLQHASVAALLGDRSRATALIAKALRLGSREWRSLHWAGAFDALRGYPPFDMLAKPVEDPVHIAEVLRRKSVRVPGR